MAKVGDESPNGHLGLQWNCLVILLLQGRHKNRGQSYNKSIKSTCRGSSHVFSAISSGFHNSSFIILKRALSRVPNGSFRSVPKLTARATAGFKKAAASGSKVGMGDNCAQEWRRNLWKKHGKKTIRSKQFMYMNSLLRLPFSIFWVSSRMLGLSIVTLV